MTKKITEKRTCEICGFTNLVDEHHIIPKIFSSQFKHIPNEENIVYLCPNHHFMIHRNKKTLRQLAIEVNNKKIIKKLDKITENGRVKIPKVTGMERKNEKLIKKILIGIKKFGSDGIWMEELSRKLRKSKLTLRYYIFGVVLKKGGKRYGAFLLNKLEFRKQGSILKFRVRGRWKKKDWGTYNDIMYKVRKERRKD